MKALLYMLSAPLAIIGERLSSEIEQASELLTSRTRIRIVNAVEPRDLAPYYLNP